MGYDIVSGLKFAVAGFHDRQVQVWGAFYAAVLLAAGIATLALVAVVSMLYAMDIVIFGMPMSTIVAATFTLLFILLTGVVFAFFFYQFCRNAMKLAGYEQKGNQNFVQFFLVNLRTVFLNLFSWYDKRVLAVVLVIYGLTVMWIAAGYFLQPMKVMLGPLAIAPLMVQIGLGFLGFAIFAHYIGIVLHKIRTMFAPMIYLKDGMEGPAAPMRSFALVRGQTLDVAVAVFGGGLVFLMAAIPSVLIMVTVIGIPLGCVLLSAISYAAVLYLVNMFKHYDEKGPSEKQKKMSGKKEEKASG